MKTEEELKEEILKEANLCWDSKEAPHMEILNIAVKRIIKNREDFKK